jgi:LmbE family N-acetylglucosaminyl deacetylase
MKKVLVVSAHADDEVFGMGGTLCKLRDADVEIHWVILTKLWEPQWNSDQIKQRQQEIQAIVNRVKFKTKIQWDFPDNQLDTIPISDMQTKMIQLLDELQPDTIFTPSPWDFNFEHKIAFELIEISTKPFYSPYIKKIIAYEIPSSTDWSLGHRSAPQANWHVDIKDFSQEKWSLCEIYKDETYEFPHPRSQKGVQAFSQKRGCESGTESAEAFWIVRSLWK